MTTKTSINTGKARYSTPQLKEFGSVRNLTGGSGGTRGDGQLGQTRL
ncbi:hypothetical protein CP97_04065 [Aurantiacibacter atlanticus]|uniref:Lasso RiPP family leader peptide-containing protein n=1 Tax=Aurantiacibacter atlanticus TaxID=1648404 RepID=A0A0H4VA83_9SPHN|nr:lasso RiPP family leader peptide-containing protein [Aurantiacibacter atlanticus]AKQ41385.2 hypothetical protein CP97_04065 [Aurantiacibacter atlanticus]MDF1836183.1 lasso RiPP family leader peptide-containing protein [Alteraurantiacibacter sp. bin_em_oilr2.035]